MFRILGILAKVVLGLATAVLIAAALGWLVQILWNALMPAIFHLPAISYWQAAGLMLLSRLLFGHVAGHNRRPNPNSRLWKRKHFRSLSGGGQRGREHFDEWWNVEGERLHRAFEGSCDQGWGWWRWWKREGKAAYETWLSTRQD